MKSSTGDICYELTEKHPNINSNIPDIETVPFDGQELSMVVKDDHPYVDIEKICDNTGLNFGREWLRLRNSPNYDFVVIKGRSSDGKIHDLYCLSLFQIQAWLDGLGKNDTCVYIIKNKNNLVKIGFSKEPKLRLKTLESQGGCKITNSYVSVPCPDYRSIEKSMHTLFQSGRKIGEWFDIDFDEAVTELKSMIAQYSDFDGTKRLGNK